MDEKSIAVVIWIKDEEAGKKQKEYLSALNLPEGYHAEIVEVSDADFRTQAYEIGRNKTSAKYKLYLDENTIIVNENIFADILHIFDIDESVGIIGVLGTEKIPTNGVCAWANKRIGKAIDFRGGKFEKGKFEKVFHEVMAVDGFLMATQYDVPWRTDLFQTDVFWDTAQCIEYKKIGYKVVVPKQDDYWCIAKWNEEKAYDVSSQQKFLDEYSNEIYPLVSVVIPTYNRPRYFKEALDSVLSQTYRNLEIFITDNSDNTKTQELMQPYLKKYNHIIYEYHPDVEGAEGNWRIARNYNNPKAIYVNWLMDDDRFMPEKIAQMVDCYEQNDGIALVTSYREVIDSEGRVVKPKGWVPTFEQTAIVNGKTIGREILMTGLNFIGEPTTVLIKKEYMHNSDLGFSGEEGKYGISDFPTWLACLQHGDLYYIINPLSQFRMHAGQQQRDSKIMVIGAICMGLEIEYARKKGIYLESGRDFETAVVKWLGQVNYVISEVRNRGFDSDDIKVLKKLAAKLLSMD